MPASPPADRLMSAFMSVQIAMDVGHSRRASVSPGGGKGDTVFLKTVEENRFSKFCFNFFIALHTVKPRNFGRFLLNQQFFGPVLHFESENSGIKYWML